MNKKKPLSTWMTFESPEHFRALFDLMYGKLAILPDDVTHYEWEIVDAGRRLVEQILKAENGRVISAMTAYLKTRQEYKAPVQSVLFGSLEAMVHAMRNERVTNLDFTLVGPMNKETHISFNLEVPTNEGVH